jgi:O-antigen biosynthesis protein
VNQRVRARAKFFFEGDHKFFLKGVTYGTFAPDADGYYVGPPEKARIDLSLMRDAGVNGVRVYHAPPKWFLDLASEFGVRVMVTLWWGQNVDFLSSAKRRREIFDKVHLDVKLNAGHPALLAYLVANEIPSTMVRWYGVRRVTDFVENIVNVGRDTDDDVLFSYASYPPTEYLLPTNVDFYTFNVYLHRRSDFERYLARLQNLVEDRPLIMGEFGIDTLRHTEDEQADILRWHVESVVRGGLAGTFLYTWTDEWWCNGQDITDWAFGLTTRERKPKKALSAVKELFSDGEPISRKIRLPRYPKVSVIVCSYNGAKTLDRCLESLRRLDYPDYEVILVDDGSKDNTQEIATRHPWIANIWQENSGLSVARNVGAQMAAGEVLAYTDSDCMADPEWLYFMVGTLLSGNFAGVGGPNISPPAENWIQACVAAAPGGPNHVLLTDLVAEHIPGCNMAFYKWAFERMGGFDPEYRKAGDDVDFCWRLQKEGQIIGFSPSAIVWHYRRFTLSAFRKQQIGYGEAESLLRFKHLVFFGPTGTAKWKGQIYGAVHMAHQPANYLSRNLWRGTLPVHLPHASIRRRGLSEQYRMGGADALCFLSLDSPARFAHRALSHVWRHVSRSPVLHDPCEARAAARHSSCPPSCCVSRSHAAARARLVALLHMVEVQTHTSCSYRVPRKKLHPDSRKHLQVELLDGKRTRP